MKSGLLFILVLVFLFSGRYAFAQTKSNKQVKETQSHKNEGIVTASDYSIPTKADGTKNAVLFKNDICLPSKLYMLSDVQNDIFVEPLIKRWRPFNDVVRFSGSAKFQKKLLRVASINTPADASTVTISLINQDNFDTIKSITTTIIVGKLGVESDSIPFSIIGDSFTNGAFFKDALLVKRYVQKIQMIGLRNISGFLGQFDEGRGGWTLARYFSVTNGPTQAYNGFWQPDGLCKYWGSTFFWKLANDIRLNPAGGWSFDESYNSGRFSTPSLLFDKNTGYLLNPGVNDLMFDNSLGYYVMYDGVKWKQTTYGDYTWNFNYGKYLSMWNLKSPLILAEFLGLNDFRSAHNPANIDFDTWNTHLKIVAESYLKAVPKGKFVIMIPSSACGIMDNTAGDFTIKQNACMWELRRNIIDNFDKKESENIYIVDAAISIDGLNGFNFTADSSYVNPYSYYTGKERFTVQTGNPHPYLNYPSMGVSLAAFIQKYR